MRIIALGVLMLVAAFRAWASQPGKGRAVWVTEK